MLFVFLFFFGLLVVWAFRLLAPLFFLASFGGQQLGYTSGIPKGMQRPGIYQSGDWVQGCGQNLALCSIE
jgi:hypothetical protein